MNINNNKNKNNNINNLKSFQVLEKINNLDSKTKLNRENNKQVSNIKTKEQNTVGRRIKDGYIENYNYNYEKDGSRIISLRTGRGWRGILGFF